MKTKTIILTIIFALIYFNAQSQFAVDSLWSFPRYDGTNTIVVKWKLITSSVGDSISIQRDNGSGFSTIQTGISLSTLQFEDNSASVKTLYTYRAILYDAGNPEDTSNISHSILAIHWPVMDNSHEIGAVFRDYLIGNTWNYHEGVDFVGYLKNVNAIRGGVVYRTKPSNEHLAIIKVDIGAGKYEYDYYHHLEDTSRFQGKKTMFAGENIGIIDSGKYHPNYDHLHYTVTNIFDIASPLTYGVNDPYGSNLLNPLKVFDDALYNDSVPNPTDPYNTPVEVDSAFYALSNVGQGIMSKENLFGKAYIFSSFTDKMNNFADPMIKKPGIYKAGYWIECIAGGGADVKSATSPYIVCKYDNDWFNNPLINITQTFKDTIAANSKYKFIDFYRADTVYGTPIQNIPYNKQFNNHT